jgi:hypothetical protein
LLRESIRKAASNRGRGEKSRRAERVDAIVNRSAESFDLVSKGHRRGRTPRQHPGLKCSWYAGDHKTYRCLAQSELKILAILDTLDQALNDVVVESNGKGLGWDIRVLPRRTLQEETAIWNFECHDRS